MQQIDLLTEAQVREVLADDFGLALDSTIRTFTLLGEGMVRAPVKAYLQRDDFAHTADRLVALPALIRDHEPLLGTKVIGSHPDNTARGLNRASAVIILTDPETMHPVAIMPGALISAMRTLATATICLQSLSAEASKVGLIGMGRLGHLAVQWLPSALPALERIQYCSSIECTQAVPPSVTVERLDSVEQLLQGCETVVVATRAPAPYIEATDLGPTWVIVNLSLMDCGTSVLEAATTIVVDDVMQATSAKKVLRSAIDSGAIDKTTLRTIPDLISGSIPDVGPRVLVNPIGLGAQDVHLAHKVWETVREQGDAISVDWD